jgi:hypothetical protein
VVSLDVMRAHDVANAGQSHNPVDGSIGFEPHGLVELVGPLADGPGLRGGELHLHPLAGLGVGEHDQQPVVPVADRPGVAPVVMGLPRPRDRRDRPPQTPEHRERLEHRRPVVLGIDHQREPDQVVHRPDGRRERRATLDRRLDLPRRRRQPLDRIRQADGLRGRQPLVDQVLDHVAELGPDEVGPHLTVRHRLDEVAPQRLGHALEQLLLRGRRIRRWLLPRARQTLVRTGDVPDPVGPVVPGYSGGLTSTDPGLTAAASRGSSNVTFSAARRPRVRELAVGELLQGMVPGLRTRDRRRLRRRAVDERLLDVGAAHRSAPVLGRDGGQFAGQPVDRCRGRARARRGRAGPLLRRRGPDLLGPGARVLVRRVHLSDARPGRRRAGGAGRRRGRVCTRRRRLGGVDGGRGPARRTAVATRLTGRG